MGKDLSLGVFPCPWSPSCLDHVIVSETARAFAVVEWVHRIAGFGENFQRSRREAIEERCFLHCTLKCDGSLGMREKRTVMWMFLPFAGSNSHRSSLFL